jgi:hypothetical protein
MAGSIIVRHTRHVDLEDSEEAAAAGELLPSDWNGDDAHEVVGAAPLDSPEFVNAPTAPTPATDDTSRRLATMEAVHAVVAASRLTVAPTLIGIAQSPYTVLSSDTVIFVDSSGGPVVINLQPAADRAALDDPPLAIKDVATAAINNIRINPNGVETVEGLPYLPINANYGGFKLYPANGKYVILP